jgi:carbon-monoxide dehydrogenase medium subunit
MKPPPLRYRKPVEVDEALALLADPRAVPLAGGQDLVPLLNSRAVRPSTVVDIGGLEQLRGIADGAAHVRIGALTRHRQLLDSPVVRDRLGVLHRAAGHIGHGAIRNRGTVGGSCASALPGAELPTVLVALDAVVHLVSATGSRVLPAAEFFLGDRRTGLAPGELIDGVAVPVPAAGTRWTFAEHTRRGAFKFPLVSVVVLRPPPDATAPAARIVVGGGAAGPVALGDEDVAGLVEPQGVGLLGDLADRLAFTDEPHAGRLFKARVARSLIRDCLRSAEVARRP